MEKKNELAAAAWAKKKEQLCADRSSFINSIIKCTVRNSQFVNEMKNKIRGK